LPVIPKDDHCHEANSPALTARSCARCSDINEEIICSNDFMPVMGESSTGDLPSSYPAGCGKIVTYTCSAIGKGDQMKCTSKRNYPKLAAAGSKNVDCFFAPGEEMTCKDNYKAEKVSDMNQFTKSSDVVKMYTCIKP